MGELVYQGYRYVIIPPMGDEKVGRYEGHMYHMTTMDAYRVEIVRYISELGPEQTKTRTSLKYVPPSAIISSTEKEANEKMLVRFDEIIERKIKSLEYLKEAKKKLVEDHDRMIEQSSEILESMIEQKYKWEHKLYD